jgi:hypothetical protein
VLAQISTIACTAKNTRTPLVDDSDKPELHLSGTTPAEYCRGFASDACSRITAMINGQAPIPPCKPGFALTRSGYTPEQIRACQVKDTIRDAQTPKLVVASTTPLESANPRETVIGQWSGEGNGKSNQFHIARGPWRFWVKTTEDDVFVSADVYRVADHTLVTSFGGTDLPPMEVVFWGDFYFVIKTAGSWTVTIVSPSSAAQK